MGFDPRMIRLIRSLRGPRALKIVIRLNAGLFGPVRLTPGSNRFGPRFCGLARRLRVLH